ncbi:hypothetical protein D3C71_1316310 [compost metagenome]
MVPAFEGEHEALAVAGVAYDLERILDRLGAAHIEVNAARAAPFLLRVLSDPLGQLDLGGMQILAGDLRQRLQLLLHHGLESLVLVAKVHCRVPHLQVQVGRAFGVVHVAAIAACEDLRRIYVVNRIAKGTIFRLVSQ